MVSQWLVLILWGFSAAYGTNIFSLSVPSLVQTQRGYDNITCSPSSQNAIVISSICLSIAKAGYRFDILRNESASSLANIMAPGRPLT